MFSLLVNRFWAIILIMGITLIACSDQQELSTLTNPDTKIATRTVVPDSVFQSHNDFIIWVFDNYYDSTVYYASDPVQFIEFAERMRYLYNGASHNISSVVIDDGKLIFTDPYYEEGVGFTDGYGGFSDSWYENAYEILDSTYNAIEGHASEATVLAIIDRGKDRVNALSGLSLKDELLSLLTQAEYSVSLMFYMDDEYGGIMPMAFNPCILVAAYADVSAYQFFNELGDTDPGDPMYSFAMTAIAGVSLYSFSTCHCSGC